MPRSQRNASPKLSTLARPRRRKDGSITYQVRYRVTRGDRRVQTSQSFGDSRSAARFAQDLDIFGAERAEEILRIRLGTNDESTSYTISSWMRHHTERATGILEETRRRHFRFIDLDVDPFMGSLPIEAYTEELDATWVEWLAEERGNGAKTIHNKHGFASHAMAAAARRRPEPLIPVNPCSFTRLPPVQGRRRSFLTPVEFELFEAVLWPKYRPMFEFMVMSMLRPGEVFALTVGDVDRETGAVNVDKAWKYANGKRLLGAPKSARGVRVTYVPLSTLERIDLDRGPDELLFPTGVGTAFTIQGFYGQIWMPAVRRLEALADRDEPGRRLFGRGAHWSGETPAALLERFGVELVDGLLRKWVVPYITRHTGISWRLQQGVPMWVVSRDAGHESESTTDKRYGHIDTRASLAAVRQVSGLLPKLRSDVAELELERRRRLVRAGQLGEVDETPNGFEAIWMDETRTVCSQEFTTYEDAVDHVARFEYDQAPAA